MSRKAELDSYFEGESCFHWEGNRTHFSATKSIQAPPGRQIKREQARWIPRSRCKGSKNHSSGRVHVCRNRPPAAKSQWRESPSKIGILASVDPRPCCGSTAENGGVTSRGRLKRSVKSRRAVGPRRAASTHHFRFCTRRPDDRVASFTPRAFPTDCPDHRGLPAAMERRFDFPGFASRGDGRFNRNSAANHARS